MNVIRIQITEEEYKMGVLVTSFLCNLNRYNIINDNELDELIKYFAEKYARECRERKKINNFNCQSTFKKINFKN
ncbi:hypothetical protein [uncultured Brachyspira sp.]|mgnify:CR=1 FL=1|jgi:hypothetical protein|uniref:hypothetical protein n=1 Tax=uncultured Brachyspira sp. TaxID=221953 RepID=UPI003208FCB3